MLADGAIKELRWDQGAVSGETLPIGSEHWWVVEIDPDSCQVLDDFAWITWNAAWGPAAPRGDDRKPELYAPPEPPVVRRRLLLDKASFEAVCGATWPSGGGKAERPPEPASSAPEQEEAPKAPPKKRRSKPDDLIRQTFDDGVLPDNLTYKQLIQQIEGATGEVVGERTLRRWRRLEN